MTCQAAAPAAMLGAVMKRLAIVLACGLATLAPLPSAGQALDQNPLTQAELPLPPASRVFDEAGLLSRETARLERISRHLKELDRDFGWPVYLVVYASLLGWSPEEQALALREAWVKNPAEGLVIVYESDTRTVAFGRPLHTLSANGTRNKAQVGRIAAFELQEVINRAVAEAAPQEQQTERLEVLVSTMTNGLRPLLERKPESGFTGDRLRFALILVGGISVIALIALIATRLFGRSEKRRRRTHLFPDVEVALRLGAPYGGGRVTARAFRGNGAARGGSGPTANGDAG